MTLSGLVVDEDERPLAGVEVAATLASPEQRPPAFHPDAADARAYTDAEGRFQIALLRAGASYALSAELLGFEPAAVEVAMPPAAAEPHPPVRIVLGSGTLAYGRIVDLDEQPVAGAEVRLRAAEHRLSRRSRTIPLEDDPFAARSDATGRFKLTALPSAEVDITVRGAGFAPLRVNGVAVPVQPRPADLGTLVLEPGASVTGRVTDTEGAGIAGVEVWATQRPLRRSLTNTFFELRNVEPDTETGEDGRFEVPDLAPGDEFHLLFRGRGYLPAARRAVEIPPPEPIDVVLIAGATASGRVVDEDEQPIAGAVVSVWPQARRPGEIDVGTLSSEHEQSAASDDEGYFFLDTLAPGSYEIEAFAPAFQASERETLEATAGGEIADLVFVLKRGATLEGQVLTTDDEPVEGARVMVDRPAAKTDAEGFYRVEGIPPGIGTVEVWHPELQRVVREIEIKPGENTLDLRMESGYPVSGLVRGEDGTLLAEVDVELQGGKQYRTYSAVTDETGSFRFPRVARGSYLIRALKKGFAPTEIPDGVEVSDAAVEHLDLPLRVGAVLAGRIRGLTFEELAKVRVLARVAGGGMQHGYVDYEGNYEIRDLGSGDWQLRAFLEGGRRETNAWVTIEPGSGRIQRDLEFRTGFALSGRVLHNGTPVADALVSIAGRDVAVRRQVIADYQGGFRIEDLLPGGYRLEIASSRELITESRDLRLEGDLDLVIEITTAEVSGRVLAAGGEPLGDALVMLQRLLASESEGGIYALGTDHDGNFRFARISGGRYRVNVHKDGYGTWQQELLVDVAGASLEVILEPTAGLELVVQLASGQRPRYVTVHVSDQAGGRIAAESRSLDAAGHVRFPTVPPGTWSLLVGAPGAVPTRAVAEVPGEPIALVLPVGGRLEVRVPALAALPLLATVSLFDPEGQPFVGLDEATYTPCQAWSLEGGRGVVEGLPAGLWNVEVAAADGQSWSGTVLTSGGEAAIRIE